jgi:uncharacterized membrane protein
MSPHPRRDLHRPPRRLYRALEAKSLRSRSLAAKIADTLTAFTSTPGFLFANVIGLSLWIILNSDVVPGFIPFDPFPFSLLTMVVSLEAIMLSIFVLISQSRAAQTATLREELHLRVNLIAEQEITKSLQLLHDIHKTLKIEQNDPELDEMLKDVNAGDIEHSILQQIERADHVIGAHKFSKKDIPSLLQVLMHGKK